MLSFALQLAVLLVRFSLAAPRASTEQDDIGIGIDLTPSYGTIAASFINGSNIALAKIDGDRSYRDLVYWLAVDSRNLAPTNARLPLSTLRVVLDDTLQSLITAGSERLGSKIEAAAVSLPCHNRVHHDYDFSVVDIMRSAFFNIGLKYVDILQHSYWGEPMTYVENSVVAGHQLGLCHPYTNASVECIEAMPEDVYLLIGYYDHALELTRKYYKVAYNVWANPRPSWHLGREVRANYTSRRVRVSSDEAYYWEQVRHELIRVIPPGWRSNVTKVVTYGPYGNNPRLREEVMGVLEHFSHAPTWIADDVNGVYAGALGTAELMKRKPYWDRAWRKGAQHGAYLHTPDQIIVA